MRLARDARLSPIVPAARRYIVRVAFRMERLSYEEISGGRWRNLGRNSRGDDRRFREFRRIAPIAELLG